MKKNTYCRIVNTTIVVAAMLLWVAATAAAQVTKYTDEAAYLAALATLGYSTFQEGFENDAVWGSVRSSIQGTNSAPSISSMGITWASNHAATNGITTGSGAAKTGNWGIYDPDHGVATGTPGQCDVETPPPECFFHDGVSGTKEPGGGSLHGVGGWIRTSTPPARINFILDGTTVEDFETIELGTTFLFFGVIDTNGFNSFEIRETEGAVGDEKFIFADDFTFGKLTDPNPSITNPEIIGSWGSGIWYWDTTASLFTNMTELTGAIDIAAGDFNADGIADVASSWVSGLWYQDGSTLAWTFIDSVPPSNVTAGDVTGDGRDEIIVARDSGIDYWDATTSQFTEMTTLTGAFDIAAGDFNADGIADVASSWVSGLWYQDGSTLDWIFIDSVPPSNVTAGDVTGDGRDEIIVARDNGIYYWDATTSQFTEMTTLTGAFDIAAGDFNADGIADVASSWGSGLWYQDGSSLAWTPIFDLPPNRVTAGDVTGQ